MYIEQQGVSCKYLQLFFKDKNKFTVGSRYFTIPRPTTTLCVCFSNCLKSEEGLMSKPVFLNRCAAMHKCAAKFLNTVKRHVKNSAIFNILALFYT